MLYKEILIALECTDEQNNVINEAIRLAETLNADLSAFHVNDPAAGKAHMMMDTLPLVSEEDIREQFRKAGYEKEANEIKITLTESESYAKESLKQPKISTCWSLAITPKMRFSQRLSILLTNV